MALEKSPGKKKNKVKKELGIFPGLETSEHP
jgi:hypothetical protein